MLAPASMRTLSGGFVCYCMLVVPQTTQSFTIRSCRRPHVRPRPTSLTMTDGGLQDNFRRVIAGTILGALLSVSPDIGVALPSATLEAEVEQFNTQSLVESKLAKEGAAQRKQDRKRGGKSNQLPFVEKKEDFRFQTVQDDQLLTSVKKIQALNPYLDEVEYLIVAKKWDYLQGFLGVFAEQEEEFVDLIDGMHPSLSPADKSAREAMQYEAQNVFLALDDLNQAASHKRVKASEKAFVKLALAYDRFIKAGGLLTVYDPVTSTEPFYTAIPDTDLVYDTKPPELRSPILILKGPDKGRTGRLIGIIKSRDEGIVRMDYMKEVKLLSLSDCARQLTTEK